MAVVSSATADPRRLTVAFGDSDLAEWPRSAASYPDKTGATTTVRVQRDVDRLLTPPFSESTLTVNGPDPCTIHFTRTNPLPATLRTRIAAGGTWDVVIAPPAVLDEFAKAGKIENERVTLGRVGMGVAVRAGAPIPDISNVEAFERSVLAAESLVFTRGSSGVYFEALLKKMALYEQVQDKITRYEDGESVMGHVLKGKGKEVSFGQLTEIRLYLDKGLRLVGPLPAEVQNYTTYAGAPMTARANAEVARAFVRHLGSPDGQAMFVAAGIER